MRPLSTLLLAACYLASSCIEGPEIAADAGLDQAADSEQYAPQPDASALIAPDPALPTAWTKTFIGPSSEGAEVAPSRGGRGMRLRARGEDIWGERDDFLFVHQRRAGDFRLTAHLTSVEGERPYAKAGLMARATLDLASPHATIHASPLDIGHFFTTRAEQGGESRATRLDPAPERAWIRISRVGDTVAGERSEDGHDWELVGSIQWPREVRELEVGLVATSHDVDAFIVADFDEIAWSTPEPLAGSCGDGTCMLADTCTTCPRDCSCQAQGVPEAPYAPQDAPAPRAPARGAPVVLEGVEYRVVDERRRHYYSNVPALNADDSLILLQGDKPPLIDARTLGVIRELDLSGYDSHRSWLNLPEHRALIFAVTRTAAYTVDVETQRRELIYDFSERYDEIAYGPGEGSVSIDDRVVALVGQRGDDAVLVSLDIEARRILGERTLKGRWPRGERKPRLDYAMVSASGQWIVVNTRYDGRGGIVRYDLAFEDRLELTSLGKHSDVCTDQAGQDVLVSLTSPPQVYSIEDGGARPLAPSANAFGGGHVSCRNSARPGWAYISRRDTKELLAFRLDDSGVVERFGWHFSTERDYQASARASVSRDGALVIFNSDWGEDTRAVGSFMARRAP